VKYQCPNCKKIFDGKDARSSWIRREAFVSEGYDPDFPDLGILPATIDVLEYECHSVECPHCHAIINPNELIEVEVEE